jgi:hypothetical protein
MSGESMSVILKYNFSPKVVRVMMLTLLLKKVTPVLMVMLKLTKM